MDWILGFSGIENSIGNYYSNNCVWWVLNLGAQFPNGQTDNWTDEDLFDNWMDLILSFDFSSGRKTDFHYNIESLRLL